MYQPRKYRKMMNGNRFRNFNICYLETDLWIGISPESYMESMEDFVMEVIVKLRNDLELFEFQFPGFFDRMIPAEPEISMPEIVFRLCDYSTKAKVGPMAAIAGAFSEFIGNALLAGYEINELVIENGGDCFMKIENPATVSVYAGDSPLSEKVGVVITPEYSPIGICTSSGTVGHSISLGSADAVMIASKKTAFADAMATAFANQVKCKTSVKQILEKASDNTDIVSTVIIYGEQMGYQGPFELFFFNEITCKKGYGIE